MDFLFVYTYIYLHMSIYFLFICIYQYIYLFFHMITPLTAKVILNAFSINRQTLHDRTSGALHFVMFAMCFNQSNKFNQFENFR
nr:MAG TPA: hypothetical protein [Caudoviricetes sp.]